MSLTSSMWSSVSGLLAHGQRMSTIGNNISNINTVGYKGSRMDFQDILYSSIGTNYGNGQIGSGTGIGIVMNDFSQGSFETTTSVTDVAISGNGFFKVSPTGSDASYYTRAGNFSLTKEGYVVDSNGYVLQGWSLNGVSKGAPTDIQLDTATCPPQHTTEVDVQINLPATSGNDNTQDATNPFFALLNTWDATQTPPLGSGAYAFETTLNVYDEGGTLHTLTIYYDKVANDVTNSSTSETYWEYIITMDPGEDVRDFSSAVGDITTTADVPEKLKGLLGAGTLTFNSSGQITDMTCFVPQTDGTSSGAWWSGASGSESVDLSTWVEAPMNTSGFPLIAPNFSGSAGLSNAYLPGTYTQPNQYADGRLIAVDFGLSSATADWNFPSLVANNDLTSQTAYSASTDAVNNTGATQTFDFTYNGTAYSVDVADGDSLDDLIAAINATGSGVTAGAATNSTGTVSLRLTSSSSTDRIFVSGGSLTDNAKWTYASTSGTSSTGLVTAADVGAMKNNIIGLGSSAERSSTAVTCQGDSYQEYNLAQNGYTFGYLSNISIAQDGTISGVYSNGKSLELYQMALYNFPSLQNLRHEGNNLFAETAASGVAVCGEPGTGQFGTVQSYRLEQSNVDLSTEFVNMIATQRGFQANSKSITTVDTMLETVIGMKR